MDSPPSDATIRAFYCNPPWNGGVARYRVGLGALAMADWLPERADAQDVARKQDLFRSRSEEVLAVLETARPHIGPFVELLSRSLDVQLPTSSETDPRQQLAWAALQVPDDLCFMVRDDVPGDTGSHRSRSTSGLSGKQARTSGAEGCYRLAAAALCAPSYWTLRDKLGLPLTGLHAGHEGLNELLADRMQAVFDRLPQTRVLERRNWFLHGPGSLFEPRDRRLDDPSNIADLVVRTERQTLRRLNERCVVFTIRVRLIPFAAIRDFPQAAADMATCVRSLSAVERKAFSQAHRLPELLQFLDTAAARMGP